VSWFRSKRKVATEAATLSLRPLIAVAQMSGGMSQEMWRDPYLLGFMYFTASFYGKAETNGKVGPADLGFALMDAFTNASNMNGKAIVGVGLDFADSKNPDFTKGMHDAMTTAYFAAGVISEDDPDQLVQSSVGLGRAMSGLPFEGGVQSAISGAMIQNSFLRRVKEMRADNA
jgi:hypothetical protein